MNDPNRTGPHQPDTSDEVVADQPQRIGRFRVERILGRGGFGLIYLAHDEQLQRLVAVKVPHRRLVSRPEDAEVYRIEARTIAGLDHPNIVPVYDVGGAEDCPCFVVSKYIDGSTLAQRIQANRPSVAEAAELTSTVAETLHYAHRKGLVHRDIKPSNILLDNSGRPFVADFGLALRERDIGTGPRYVGTPAYMSPEQARGEGHRIDGRSDIFSLGVVLYELLTGRRPFPADSREELLEQITNMDVRPPRQWDDTIPKEVERICLKALSKRASERYTTAKDMADDLRHWLRPLSGGRHPAEVGPEAAGRVEPALAAAPGLSKIAFLSYATPDKDAAFRLCQLLEEQGIGCWIAPRDVTPGADYGEAIIRAIEATTATVLFLSAHANASIHVKHEVERATSKRKRVIPIRLEDVPLSPSLELHLATAHWLDAWRLSPDQVAAQLTLVLRGEGMATPSSPAATPASDSQPIRIVPKGLRSFDAHDADFFLELLPGPRDRDGLPDSIRFWKTRIEETDADDAFTVGLIYGPSGCGKSSLVKAGLLPRLSDKAIAVYVEATADETETRLLNGLRKRCPALSGALGLRETLAALRRGQGVPVGKKVLIVLDQFEQWLHAKKEEQNPELVRALRQCDGGRVQCVVMVRDDFWMAATRFMRDLEVRLVEAQNSAAVDLFPIRHAEKVLAAFGRAFGVLPDGPGEASTEQKEFLHQAVSGLAQEGKVISVRLALFSEMMKGKAWTPATLKEVGGAEGVGVAFLEGTFSATAAPPEHRYHQKAARAVLKALLPESGTDIKGHMRSYAKLLDASGYANRPKDFDDLLRILDGEIRLITPTDPEGQDEASGGRQPPDDAPDRGADAPRSPVRFYQLTHDYLVPSLRDWLTRKQKETRRGRAELLLADRAVVWNARPENRQLPSLSQWFRIRWLTAKKNWTPPQRKMMGKAARYHAVRGMLVAVLLFLIGWGGYEGNGTLKAHALVDGLLRAETTNVPAIVEDMAPYRRWVNPLLHEAQAQAEKDNDRPKQLHTSMALLPVDASQAKYLYGRLLEAEPAEVPVIRDALAPHKEEWVDQLWAVAEAPEKGKESQRLRAAAALAKYDPEGEQWGKMGALVVNDLVRENPVFLGQWSEAFRPVKDRLLPRLAEIFRDQEPERAAERSLATNLLADYAADQAQMLADLLMDADEKQFAVIYPKFKEQAEQGLPLLNAEVDRKPPPDLPSSDPKREKLAKRQANAVVALLRMNQVEKVWPQLMRRDEPGKPDDPRVRSYAIHRFGPLGADARVLVKRLAEEPDVTIRRALILSLGPEEFEGEPGGVSPRSPLPPEEKKLLVERLRELYRTAADPGLRAAAEWLLRQWQEEAWLAQTDEAAAKDKEGRAMRLGDIQRQLAGEKDKAQPRWYVNGQGQTMVVLPGPMEFLMGSAPKEDGKNEGEDRHKERIGRTFAVAAKPVTLGQFQTYWRAVYNKDYDSEERFTPMASCPVNYISWAYAAAYCNWLSKQEDLPQCYETDAGGRVVKLKENYLSLTGYRLPTEAEWEYACRAGAATSRYYGETPELLGKYAWYLNNSQEKTHPVGSKKPNDFGFFDLHGNVYSWCQEQYDPYPMVKEGETIEDKEDIRDIDSNKSRVLRGGSFLDQASDVRSANRISGAPATRTASNGFRPARTFIP